MKPTIGVSGLGLLAIVLISGCDDKCPGTYHCPSGTISIALPADIAARVRTVAGDTCTAQLEGAGGRVDLESSTKTACRVRARLNDGSVEETIVTFRSVGDCCRSFSADGTPFTATDAGID